MVILSNSDYFQVKLASLIADYDKDTMVNFYQPILGFQGYALYMSLISEAANEKVLGVSTHETLFLMLRMAPGEFIKTRKALEGIGLLKTYLSKSGDSNAYTYVIYAPKTPKEFFEDILLHGTLIKYAGETYVNRLKNIYNYEADTDLGNDVSVSFNEIYSPNFDDPAYTKALNSGHAISRNISAIKTEFSYEIFFDELAKVSQIDNNAIGKREMREIERISSLYGLDESIMAGLVATQYNPTADKGKRIDFKSLTKCCQEETNYAYLSNKKINGGSSKVTSKSDLGSKINLMEKTAPSDYLALLQNGAKPAVADLKIIDYISKNFNFPNSVINAIVDYCLAVNNNILSKNYVEKISASVAREGVTTTLDTMNYLKSVMKGQSRTTSKKDIKKLTKTSKKENLEEIDDIIAELEEEDDDNAKA